MSNETDTGQSALACLAALGVPVWQRRDLPSCAPEAVAAPESEVTADAPVGAATTDVAGRAPEVPPSQGVEADARSDAELPQLEQMVAQCTLCGLSETRRNTVFGVGNPDADWFFVGEAPGAEEDRRGEPFVGRAGQLLDAMLFALSLEREQIYIANVLKCRPPANRDPMGEEVVHCEPYLHRQVDLIKPKVIVAMGRFAAQSLLRSTDAIGRLRGREHSYRDTGIPLVVTYHPAYLLRSPEQKPKVWDDLVLAKRLVTS